MRIFNSSTKERHDQFETIQNNSIMLLDATVQEGLVDTKDAAPIKSMIEGSFLPNIKGHKAILPRSRVGEEKVPIIPLREGEIIDVNDLIFDMSDDRLENISSSIGIEPPDLHDLVESLKNSFRMTPYLLGVEDEIAGVTKCESILLTSEKDGSTKLVPFRPVIGLSRFAITHHASHEMTHAIDHNLWPFEAPGLYDEENSFQRLTFTERRAYHISYGIEQLLTDGQLPDFRIIGERYKGMEVHKGFDAMSESLIQTLIDPDEHWRMVATTALTYAYGPATKADLPTPDEITAYTLAEVFA